MNEPWSADPPAIMIDDEVRHQTIDGFGVSTAFRRNELIRALSQDKQREILDLWFSRAKGAGLTILRLGIGSAPAGSPYDDMVSIQPEDPGGPDAPPKYVWDGDDNSQVWMARAAQDCLPVLAGGFEEEHQGAAPDRRGGRGVPRLEAAVGARRVQQVHQAGRGQDRAAGMRVPQPRRLPRRRGAQHRPGPRHMGGRERDG
ncbi:hypothetical protein [Nonomuraea angiospora]